MHPNLCAAYMSCSCASNAALSNSISACIHLHKEYALTHGPVPRCYCIHATVKLTELSHYYIYTDYITIIYKKKISEQ